MAKDCAYCDKLLKPGEGSWSEHLEAKVCAKCKEILDCSEDE